MVKKSNDTKHVSNESKKDFEDRESEREHCREAKRRAKALEENNDSTLILFCSTRGYWKMGGVSALEFFYNIATKAQYYNSMLLPDRDFYSKFREGVISIRDIKSFDARMNKLGIEFDHEEAGVRIYNLGYKISKKDIDEMRNERQTLLKRANQNVVPKVIDASLYAKLKSLIAMVYAKYAKMSQPEREFLGTTTVTLARKAFHDYIAFCNSEEPKPKLLEELIKVMKAMMADSAIYMETKIWDARHCVSQYQDLMLDIITLASKDLSDVSQSSGQQRLSSAKK